MEKERRRLTEAEAKARDERLKAMGITVEQPTTSTITLLATEATEVIERGRARVRRPHGAG